MDTICRQLPELLPWVKEIGITGGEPLLVPQVVRKLVEAAAPHYAVCVMTSGYWASSSAEAKKIIQSFPGLHALVISTDPYHLPFVPVDKVRTAFESARELGLEARILITLTAQPGPTENLLLEQLKSFAKDDLMTQTLKPMGRASSIKEKFVYNEEVPLIPCTTLGPLIREDGQMIPCCHGLDWLPSGHPMCVGDLHENSLVDLFRLYRIHPLVHFLRTWGFSKFFKYLNETAAGLPLPTIHLNSDQCHTCAKLCTSTEVSRALQILKEDKWFRLRVAGGRYHLLDEKEMVNIICAEMRNSLE